MGERTFKKETLIFPRYHQLDVVRKLVADAREAGAGTNYLIQHSAGSGKSNSIAWLSYQLSSLHNDADERIFDSVIVVTDRRVLNQQMQDTIYQFDHKRGVVQKIDKDSTQLANALEGRNEYHHYHLTKIPLCTVIKLAIYPNVIMPSLPMKPTDPRAARPAKR